MTKDKNIVESVLKNSIAYDLKIESGDEILSVNNIKPKDIIDYKYLINDELVIIAIKKNSGEIIEYEIEKDFDEDLGIIFTNPLIDEAKHCSNKCIFCFIDQMPPGMRESLYFKDDDSRLSFLQGNFITLTNMKEDEIERIIKYRISPINVSVHTTNKKLRQEMMHNKKAGNIMDILKRFSEARLLINCQIVCVPKINDGSELIKTLQDLYSLRESIMSVAIVPVGVTKFRQNLYPLEVFDRKSASKVIDIVESLQKEFYKDSHTRFAFLADEFYILAGREIPKDFEYEGYPQLENGVGLIRSFKEDFLKNLKESEINEKRGSVTLTTGTLAYDFINEIKNLSKEKFPNMNIKVKAVKNNFFGETITVAGLVTGTDILNQLEDDDSKAIMIPDCMLKKDTEIFLDDITINDLKTKLKKEVHVTKVEGKDFLRVLAEV